MSDARTISGSRRRQSTLTKQACDACKLRKVKCIYADLTAPMVASNQACQRCSRMILECTFSLPQKCRGPRRRGVNASSEDTGDTITSRTSTIRNAINVPRPGSSNAAAQSTESSIPDPLNLLQTHTAASSSRPVQPRRLSYLLDDDGASACTTLIPTTPSSLGHSNTHDTTITRVAQHSYQTDAVCSRGLFRRIMSDYIELLYPVVPVVHRPLFKKDLDRERDSHDSDFFLLLLGICALTLAIGSSRFEQYRIIDSTLAFESPEAMINHCYDLFICHRGVSYYEKVSHSQWAVSYCFVTAFFQIGQHNRSRILEINSMQLARLLELHHASSYEGLDFVEAQLRRKAFWLSFYSLVHNKLQYARRERLLYLDCSMLRSIDYQALLPAELEDEYITADAILPRPEDANHTNIMTAFIIHSKVFCAALMPLWRVSDSAPTDPSRADSDQCCGCECIELKLQIQSLEDRYEELRFMLDKCPPRLQPWGPNSGATIGSTPSSLVLDTQMEILRANIHVTHIWLQCMILDRIDSLRLNYSSLPKSDLKAGWYKREEIARQMLHVLHSFSDEPLEPNGYHTFCKIRDVAVSLLSCPFEEGDRVAIRANEYLHRFTEILWRLDKSELLNSLSLQTWIDTGRQE